MEDQPKPVFRPGGRFYASVAVSGVFTTLLVIGFLTVLDWLGLIAFKSVC